MLERKYRLPAGVKLNQASFYKIPSLKLAVAANGLSFNRYGFIISKKTEKKAVARNQTKRLVRSCIEQMLGQLNTGYDMLFILQKISVGKSRDVLYNEIEKLLKKVNILK